MAQFRKRRINAGPNKNEEKVRRAQEAANQGRASGRVRDRFPDVERLSFTFTSTNPQSGASETHTRALGPDDACALTVPCPGRCGRGVFDVSEKAAAAVAARQTAAEASAVCAEELFAGLPDTCGTKLVCLLEVTYRP